MCPQSLPDKSLPDKSLHDKSLPDKSLADKLLPDNIQPDKLQHDTVQESYRLDEQIGYLLRLANQRHLDIFTDAMPGLTPTQFSVLYRLAEQGDASQNELGRKVGIDAATTNGVIERLARKQLVKSRSDREDRRRLRISLTAAGRRALHEALPLARTITQRTLCALSPQEAQLLTGLLQKMQRGVDGDDTADSA